MDVLLVDDETLVRETLAEDLADAGLDVTNAPDAEAALGAASAAAGEAGGPPRVLVTDVNLGPAWTGSRWRPRCGGAGPRWASWS